MSVAPQLDPGVDERLDRPALDAPAPSPLCHCWTVPLCNRPTGDIVILRVAGDVDAGSLAVLDAALGDVLDRRPAHLVVDLTGLLFCSSRGIATIAGTARAATAGGTRCSMGGAPPQFARLWPDYWPADDAPAVHRTAAAVVLSAIALSAGP